MRMEKPLLRLVNGPAAGAGFGLAIAGDLVIAARSVHFVAAYGNVGLIPDSGLTWLLARLVGLRKAQDIILADRRIGSEEAERIGIVTHVVYDATLAAEGAAQAERLARAATGAIGAAHGLFVESFGAVLEQQLEREARTIAAVSRMPGHGEGIEVFLARRKLVFKGKET